MLVVWGMYWCLHSRDFQHFWSGIRGENTSVEIMSQACKQHVVRMETEDPQPYSPQRAFEWLWQQKPVTPWQHSTTTTLHNSLKQQHHAAGEERPHSRCMATSALYDIPVTTQLYPMATACNMESHNTTLLMIIHGFQYSPKNYFALQASSFSPPVTATWQAYNPWKRCRLCVHDNNKLSLATVHNTVKDHKYI